MEKWKKTDFTEKFQALVYYLITMHICQRIDFSYLYPNYEFSV